MDRDKLTMMHAELYPGRAILCRLEHDSDLLGSIENVARVEGIPTGVFTVIGAVKKARIGYYDQQRKEYMEKEFDQPMEIACCTGNISHREEEVMAHAHITLADAQGQCLAGHLMPGTIVFAGELYLQELKGPVLRRVHDDVTGLMLWDLKSRQSIQKICRPEYNGS